MENRTDWLLLKRKEKKSASEKEEVSRDVVFFSPSAISLCLSFPCVVVVFFPSFFLQDDLFLSLSLAGFTYVSGLGSLFRVFSTMRNICVGLYVHPCLCVVMWSGVSACLPRRVTYDCARPWVMDRVGARPEGTSDGWERVREGA